MRSSITKGIILLSSGFFLCFMGFNAVQQYITTYFSHIGLAKIGFQSLILIYLFFTLADPLSAIIVSKYGAKKSMAVAFMFYALFIHALSTKSTGAIYIASSLLGIAASLLWTGQNSYLVRATNEANRGANAGFFGTVLFLGSALGILALGFLINRYSYHYPFLFTAILPLLGLVFILRLHDLRSEKPEDHLRLLRKAITSKSAWQLSTIWFAVYFVYGLAIGLVPIEIKNTLGVSFVGSLSSLFYIMPILLSYVLGKLSDIRGREFILIISFIIGLVGLISLYISHNVSLLILGVIAIAVYYSMIYPITLALVGDVTTKKNLEYLTSFFWMIQNIGVLSSLILSTFIQSKSIYAISIGALIVSFTILLPILKAGFHTTKLQLSREVD